MSERRYCLNCGRADVMNIHGRCPCCNSDAVVLAESIYQFQRNWNESIEEAERIYALEGK